MRTKLFLSALVSTMLASVAFGQFVPGPRVGSALTIPSGGYIIHPQSLVSNIASPIPFRINGKSPIILYLDWGCTNGTTGVSNVAFGFQVSIDGSKWIGPTGHEWIDGAASKFPMLQVPGPGAGSQNATNFTGSADMSSWNWVRLYSITNLCFVGNGADSNKLYITNCSFVQGYQ